MWVKAKGHPEPEVAFLEEASVVLSHEHDIIAYLFRVVNPVLKTKVSPSCHQLPGSP